MDSSSGCGAMIAIRSVEVNVRVSLKNRAPWVACGNDSLRWQRCATGLSVKRRLTPIRRLSGIFADAGFHHGPEPHTSGRDSSNLPMHTQALPAPAAAPDYHLQPGDVFYRVAILVGFIVVVVATWKLRAFHGLLHSAHQYGWLGYVARPSLLWAGMGLLMLLFRTLLWFRYRIPPVATMEDAPTLTVIIPAFNEGEMVARTIESVATARYPRDRLEIFVIDDGSRDDTWTHIERAAARFPGLVATLRFAQNRGKRAALEAGFRRGKGEVMVTIDSDSVIDPDTLLAMAGPFRDPKVGAVAGKVSVYNRGAGIIPRMLNVRFVLSFDFLRAAQSTYGTVYCCPGALAAYRTEAVRRVLERWVAQEFLGKRCTFGEDRAM